MRNAILVSVTLAVTLFFTTGATGQQENLLVDLRVEPERAQRSLNLYEAATANNFRLFASLFAEAPQPEYAELHRLWTWSMEDPIGAFYGVDQYERLSRLYPGYRSYIEQYRIVDSHGNVFYPSAETRRFLIAEAVMGAMPVVREAPVRVARVEAPAPQPARSTAPALAPVTAAPATVAPARVAAVVSPLVAPAPAIAPVQATVPQIAAAIEPAPIVVPAPAPLPATVAAAEPVRGVVRRNEANRGALSRSILLMIAGLVGIGMITLMLHAPRDDQDRNLSSHAP